MLTGYVVQINVFGLWHTDEYDGKDEKENGGETPEAAVEAKEVLQVGEDLQHGEGEDCGDRPDETFATGTRVVWEKFRREEIWNCLDAQLSSTRTNTTTATWSTLDTWHSTLHSTTVLPQHGQCHHKKDWCQPC